MGLVQLLTALYSYRFTSNVRRKIKAKPLMTPHLHSLALAAGLGEETGGRGEAASCVWVTRMFFWGKPPHPPKSLYLHASPRRWQSVHLKSKPSDHA